MAPRPPGDAVVALRSLGRRYRSLFAGLGDDESPDDLAHRPGPDGWAAIDHVIAALRAVTTSGRSLQRTLLEAEPTLDAVEDHRAEPDRAAASGTVEERIAELAREADTLADQAERVTADEWGRPARIAGRDEPTRALDVLWTAVDAAVDRLRAAERTMQAVRGRPV